MKDIYKLLNDVKLDDSDFEEMDVTEFEKAKVKSTLKKSIIRKQKRKSWKMPVAAAAIVLSLSAATIGLAFPAYAGNIPIIGDIFRFLDNDKTGIYDNYKEFSTEMNLTQESNGIKMTVNDAVFDGKTVTVTYSIESKKEIEGEIQMLSSDLADIEGARGMIVSDELTKIDNHHYVGLSRFTPSELNLAEGEAIDIKWQVDGLLFEESVKDIKGKWKFAFSLKAADNQVQLSNGSAEKDGVQVTVEKVVFTPMSFIVHYDQQASEQATDKWDNIHVEVEVKDDVGNVYSGKGNGGFGKDTYTMSWSNTFEKLDPNATKLIVTPTVGVASFGPATYEEGETITNSRGESITTNATSQMAEAEEEWILDDIVIELEK